MTSNTNENENSPGSTNEKKQQQRIDLRTMGMPEILTNVARFLDRPTLYSCRSVSRLWHSCATYVLIQDYAVGCQDIAKVLLEEDYELSEKQQWVIDQFRLYSPQICTLTLGHYGPKHKFFHVSDKLTYTSLRPTLSMKKLLSLSIGPIADIPITPESSLLLGEAVCKLVHDSPKLEELSYKDYYFSSTTNPSLEQLVEHVGPCLRKVTLEGPFLFNNLGYLTKIFCDREQKWLQQAQPGSTRDQRSQDPGSPTVSTSSSVDTLLPILGEKDSPMASPKLSWERIVARPLEELVIRCMNVAGPNVYPDVDFDSIQGQLPIKSLTLSDFCVPFSSRDGDQPSITSLVLGILKRCPALEELRFGTSFISIYDPFTDRDFSDALTKHTGLMNDFYDTPELDEDFASELIKACPNLKKLDIGGNELLTIDHVEELLSNYMSQLVSLRIWGTCLSSYDALSSNYHPDALINLTELDLSGSLEQIDLVYLALKSARNLKRLWAMSIPLEASTIVGFDWACMELEALALSVAIPVDLSLSEPSPVEGDQDSNAQPLAEQYKDPYGIAEADIYRSPNAEGGEDSKPDEDEDDYMYRSYYGKRFQSRSQHQRNSQSTPVQIEVCKQLAKLTHLRELKLEGPAQWDKELEVESMTLTMETGLPYLEPLKYSLEKLDICQLEDQISGRREIEWLARHFYHHRHPQLHPRLKVFSRTDPIEREPFRDELVDLYRHSPMPTLRELRGVSLSGEHGHFSELNMNVEWLQMVCPSLTIQVPTY